MVQTLLHISSHAVLHGVVDGQITNASDLHSQLRHWLIDLFRMKDLLNNRNVMKLFEKPGFFHGFTKIDVSAGGGGYQDRPEDATDSEYRSFLMFMATTFRSDRHLAENITNLNISISPTAFTILCETDPTRLLAAHSLLSSCKNLKRLQLVATRDAPSDYFPALEDSSESDQIYFPVLKHLSLVGGNMLWKVRQFPKRWFKSIQSLELRACNFDRSTYLEIMTCCQDTLTALELICVYDTFRDGLTMVPIKLPKLSSFFYSSGQKDAISFEELLRNCPNLTEATLEVAVEPVPEIELRALARLSKTVSLNVNVHEIQLYTIRDMVPDVGKNIVSLGVLGSCDPELFHYVLSNCTNLQSLHYMRMDTEVELPLQNFLGDKTRAMRLTSLNLYGNICESILDAVSTNCCRLRVLVLQTEFGSGDCSSCLQGLVENGVRLVFLQVWGFTLANPEALYSLIRSSKRSLSVLHLNIVGLKRDECVTLLHSLSSCSMITSYELRSGEREEPIEIVELHNKYKRSWFHSVSSKLDIPKVSFFDD